MPPSETAGSTPLLEVDDLRTYFHTRTGVAKAVDGVSFDLAAAETLGLVGESGCGKSVTALSIMRLVSDPPGKIEGGAIRINGRDLLDLSDDEMCAVRGNDVAMIFQEPMTSLNPVITCGRQIAEAVELHQDVSRSEAHNRAIEMLRRVGIAAPEQRANEYPHQLSGGMRQRVMLAMGLSCNPQMLIADEPTTALDVTVQAQIMELLQRLQEELGMAILLITHDLGVVAETTNRAAVMYAGRIVESAATEILFANPRHPYTQGLIRSIPELDTDQTRLDIIPGTVPDLRRLPVGCRFQSRCPLVDEHCREAAPPLVETDAGHQTACWNANG